MSIDITNLRDLPVQDKLRIVTQLWDSIAASDDPVVLPQEILQEASRRSQELKDDPSIAIDDDELWRRVNG
jgi:putative addiction module component (TIGR02574 family)